MPCVLYHEVHLLDNILIVPSFEGNCVHKIPPLAPILSQMNPVHAIPPHFFQMYFNIIIPPTPVFKVISLIQFPHHSPVSIFSSAP